jgi:uncharacterized protein involved in outer membrane biogenesis
MKPWRRYALGLAVALVLLGVAAAVALRVLVDPERLKELAREKARQAWSREITIGDMSLRLLPLPAVYADNVAVVDAPDDVDPWHLHADSVVVGLELWPLITGEAKPRDVRIEGTVVRHGRPLKVVARLDDVSRHGEPDAVSDGKVDLDWGATQVTLSGRIPLQAQLRGAAFAGKLESTSLNDMLGFFGIERPRPTAAARATLELRDTGERIEVSNVDALLGKLRVTGDARFANAGPGPTIDARVQIERLDWPQALLEAGETPADPLPPDQLFYDRPLAWPLLVAMHDKKGTIEARLGLIRLRNGLELRQVKASMSFDGDRLEVKSFTTDLLGGSAKGTMHLEGRKKELRVDIEGTNLLLERWFKERSREIPFTGGPMAITASLVGTGNSVRDLARSMTGPLTIRMGPGVYASQKAGEAEAKMVTFSTRDAKGSINLECASANLPFVQGRATGDAIVGARSDMSRLLTSGYVSLHDVEVDLRGRVRPKPGMTVGLSAIVGDIRIAGNIREMKTAFDPAGKPAAAVRAGAAVATLGLTLAGSAMANAAREDSDPCADVFAKEARVATSRTPAPR